MYKNIWDEIRQMQAKMDSIFEEFFKNEPFYSRKMLTNSNLPVEKNFHLPLTDFWETDKEFKAEIDLPGIEKNNIKINAHKGMLEIKAEKKIEEKKESKGMHHFERSYTGFYRSFSLPPNADTEKTEAKLENGVLKIKIPKKELPEFKPKQIEVK